MIKWKTKDNESEDDGFNVEYDYPSVPATGEHVLTMAEAERIKAKRIKEGYINVRIEPA